MATVDGFVSQHDVVGHLQAGNLKKEKIFVDDYGLGDFGSDDCSFLAISSEWVDILDVHVDLDKSKLVLLKQKIKNKNNILTVFIEYRYQVKKIWHQLTKPKTNRKRVVDDVKRINQ